MFSVVNKMVPYQNVVSFYLQYATLDISLAAFRKISLENCPFVFREVFCDRDLYEKFQVAQVLVTLPVFFGCLSVPKKIGLRAVLRRTQLVLFRPVYSKPVGGARCVYVFFGGF